ncbi:endopeptidase La [Candidatus Sumerlaeota bacterium]|nr:endopeptidase La [Candidatus Sumerlaeota bacterium]
MDNSKDKILMPIIPLRDIVVFPHNVVPIFITRSQSINALNQALGDNKRLLFLTQKNMEIDNPVSEDLYRVGTVGEILQILRTADGRAKILIEGLYCADVQEFLKSGDFLRAHIVPSIPVYKASKKMEALKRSVLKQFDTYSMLSDRIPEDLFYSVKAIEDPIHLIDTIANYVSFQVKEKQVILEEIELEAKYLKLGNFMNAENEMLQLENTILSQVKTRIGKNQKEFYLNEQLKVIEKELGLDEEEDPELKELRLKMKKIPFSREAREKVEAEWNRLSRMAALSPEATVSRSYLDWLFALPWGKKTRDKLDIERAQKILDEEHYGLKKVKERILEYLAVHQLVKNPKGPILCFVGPPGVGKTSLARSIAKTLGRKFVRVSLGGVRDEAEIRGHRRTYIGSLPGRIIQNMKKAGSMNPVFLLDEVDKMTYDFHGDPSAALLEVLDPEQNFAFNDHYLDVDFDLSSVLFITTANISEDIPPTLLDRMETIRLPGYTQEEKVEISLRFLIPRQIREHGLNRKNLVFSREILSHIISNYTREAGVRNLEREIATICRKVAKEMVRAKKRWKYVLTFENVRESLGPPKFYMFNIHQAGEVGVATGLAWTEMGGEILATETSIVKGKGNLTLTGQLGDVMQESAKAALTYIRSRCVKFRISPNFYNNVDIHIHIPEGAIPKDGPSAGVTMATSILSALSSRPVRQDVAMTGEITLSGKVLKIGGVKEKILAAHRANIKTVILPSQNQDEVDDLPCAVRDNMKFILVKNLDEVLDAALLRKIRHKQGH